MKAAALLLTLFMFPFFAGNAHADDEGDNEAAALAHRYGMDHFDRIDTLRFTFNVREGTTTVTRHWAWDIAGGKISLVTGDRTPLHVTYNPNDLSKGNAKLNHKVDGWFLSDRQWILLPLQIVSDHDSEVTMEEEQPLPVPPGSSDCVTVEFAGAGDSYEIFYDEDRVIRQSVFHPDGDSAPATVATWSDLVRVGPILVSRRFKLAGVPKEIWFSDVEAQLRGSRAWQKATSPN